MTHLLDNSDRTNLLLHCCIDIFELQSSKSRPSTSTKFSKTSVVAIIWNPFCLAALQDASTGMVVAILTPNRYTQRNHSGPHRSTSHHSSNHTLSSILCLTLHTRKAHQSTTLTLNMLHQPTQHLIFSATTPFRAPIDVLLMDRAPQMVFSIHSAPRTLFYTSNTSIRFR